MNIKDAEFELLLRNKIMELKSKEYDSWKLDTPDYQDEVYTDKIDLTIEGEVNNLKEFEQEMIKLAEKLDLDLYY
jgi:hypothetical protein